MQGLEVSTPSAEQQVSVGLHLCNRGTIKFSDKSGRAPIRVLGLQDFRKRHPHSISPHEVHGTRDSPLKSSVPELES